MRLSERNHRFSGRLKRRAHPIIGYFGGNSSGKTWCALLDLMASLDEGYPVLSTVRILDYDRPRECPGGAECDEPEFHTREVTRSELWPCDPEHPEGAQMRVQVPTGEFVTHRAKHPNYQKWTTYQQFLDFRDGEVFGDEVTSWASSRESSKLPNAVLNRLQQLRKVGLTLRYTTPNFSRTDLGLREVTRAACIMRGTMGRQARPQPGRPPSLWTENRLFTAKTYDALDVDEYDASRMEEIRPLVTRMYWGPGSRVFDAYDTYDAVTQLGYADSTGTCIGCGGRRSQHKCSCPSDEAEQEHGHSHTGKLLVPSSEDHKAAKTVAKQAQRGAKVGAPAAPKGRSRSGRGPVPA